MKKCSTCKEEKPLDSFNKQKSKKDGLQSFCRDCQSARSKKWFEANKVARRATLDIQKQERRDEFDAIVNAIKSQPCIDCKGRFRPWQMDFDHLKDKEFNIALARARGYSLDRVRKEIEKCELVCANCHRDRTYRRIHNGNGK